MDLSPGQAAAIAKHVYAVRQESDIQTALEMGAGLGLGDTFRVDGGSRFEGASGGLLFRQRSGFGYVARGVGARQGEALVAIRGTVTARDWWTDANIGLQIGPGGWPVHAGFHDTFRSFVGELQAFFARGSFSRVHCVGHSLGGALATLTADHLSRNRIGAVSLYTFGSPRVGALGFSRSLTRRLGPEGVHRVFHDADPVSMIPIFPYAHVPAGEPGLRLSWSGGRVAVSAHFMESYIGSVGDAGWAALERANASPDWARRAESWLASASSQNVIAFSASTLWMITRALAWLVKKITLLAVGAALTAGVTVLDQLAWLLHQGAAASREIADQLGSLIGVVFRYLGRAANAVGDLTVAFVRWVLGLLWSALQNTVQRAVNLISYE